LLLTAIIGSGIAASRLSPGDTGLQLFENATATAATLVAIILAVGPVSGAHLNPVITLGARASRNVTSADAGVYVAAQVAGACLGAMIANLMFELPAVELSATRRSGAGLWLAEVVATLGLVLVISGVARSNRSNIAAFAVGAYIGAAYFFTSSTSSANPAVTVARMFSDTFAGIAPASVIPFVVAQIVGGMIAYVLASALYPVSAARPG
jgi:glycerol uptake facilitator-like aquaporin